jgi:CspA family cold shock protein
MVYIGAPKQCCDRVAQQIDLNAQLNSCRMGLASAVFMRTKLAWQSEFLAVRPQALCAIAFEPPKNPACWREVQRCTARPTLRSYLSGRRTMQKGTVKWFNPTKGYGFIRPSTGDKDVFVHISAVERAGLSTLNEGQVVEYELVTNRGKTSAENLKVA